MGFTPFPAGDGRAWTMTFTTDSGVFNLTGVSNGSIALHTEDINNNLTLYFCTGSGEFTKCAGGAATFSPTAALPPGNNPPGEAGHSNIFPRCARSTRTVSIDFFRFKSY